MRRTRLFLIVLTVALAAGPLSAAGAARRGLLPPRPTPPALPSPGIPPVVTPAGFGVPLGTPVTLRTSPDNNIVNAVVTAAARLGLGPVDVVRFSPDCSSLPGRVVVCRDINLQVADGVRSTTEVGYGFCVVRLDPRVGGTAVGTNIAYRAMKKCLAP